MDTPTVHKNDPGGEPSPRVLAQRMIKQLQQLVTVLLVGSTAPISLFAPPPRRNRDPNVFYESPIPIADPKRLAKRQLVNYCTKYRQGDIYGIFEVFSHQAQLCAEEVALMIYDLQRMLRWAPPVALAEPKPTTAQGAPTSFHRFRDLPPELCLMIWNLAVLPPTCRHFYQAAQELQTSAHTRPFPHGNDAPAASLLLPDRGLWGACKESRNFVKLAHRKMGVKITPRMSLACMEVLGPGMGDNDNDDGEDMRVDVNGDSVNLSNGTRDDLDDLDVHFHRLSDFNENAHRLLRRLSELQRQYPFSYAHRLGPHGLRLVEDLFKVDGNLL